MKTKETYNEYEKQETKVKNLVVEDKNNTWKELGAKMEYNKKQKLYN